MQVSTACGSGRVISRLESCLDNTRPLPQAVLTCFLDTLRGESYTSELIIKRDSINMRLVKA